MRVLLTTCGSWYLPDAAKALHARGALGGLWISDRNRSGIPPALFRRAWPFHAAMKPFLHLASQITTERAFHAFRPLWDAWIRRELARIPSEQEPDVVHAILGFGGEPFAHAAKTGAFKVIDCPNTHPHTYHEIWQRECDRWCPGERIPVPAALLRSMERDLASADLVIALSDFARETLVARGVDPAKISVHPLGVNTDLFVPRVAPPEKIRFICVGTICVRKGHQYLFRAFEKVRKQLPDAELVCIGEYKSDFRMERPKWEGTFTHIPHCHHPELAKWLQTSTAFVLASMEEGFARVQGEALSAGVPVIGTPPSGASTVITDGVEGFTVPAGDIDRLADAMIRIASDPATNARMGRAAAELARRRLKWQDYGDGLLAEYGRRLASRRTTS